MEDHDCVLVRSGVALAREPRVPALPARVVRSERGRVRVDRRPRAPRHAAIAAGMISERPISRPTGCAPSASAAADPDHEQRRSAARSSRDQPPPLRSRRQNSALRQLAQRAEVHAPRAAAPSARLSAKRGDTSAPRRGGRAGGEREVRAFDRAPGSSRHGRLGSSSLDSSAAGAQPRAGAARRRRNRARGRAAGGWVTCPKRSSTSSRARPRSGSRTRLRTRPDRPRPCAARPSGSTRVVRSADRVAAGSVGTRRMLAKASARLNARAATLRAAPPRAAASVAATSRGRWASETKPASNGDGAR